MARPSRGMAFSAFEKDEPQFSAISKWKLTIDHKSIFSKCKKLILKNSFFRTKFSLLTNGLDLRLDLEKRPNFLEFFEREFLLEKYHRSENKLPFLGQLFLELINFQPGGEYITIWQKLHDHIFLKIAKFSLSSKFNDKLQISIWNSNLPIQNKLILMESDLGIVFCI